MAANNRFKLYGGEGSPYSIKIRAYLRYKRIPFDWVPATFAMSNPWPKKFASIKPKVIPIIEFPDGAVMNESTRIIETIENKFDEYGDRPVFLNTGNNNNNNNNNSNNLYLQFISNLIEDFADEWVTKIMYGIRWNRKLDQDFSTLFITYDVPLSKNLSKIREFASNMAKKRQIERRSIVGCANDELIHASLHQLCGILEKHLKNNYFLFGSNANNTNNNNNNFPTNADFGLYGQLGQFRVDCTSNDILRKDYPLLFAWLYKMDDLSGLQINNEKNQNNNNNDGNDSNNKLSRFEVNDTIIELLKLIGDIYLPFLAANEKAILKNEKTFNVDLIINNKKWKHSQNTFKWQLNCLNKLRYQLKQCIEYQNGNDTELDAFKKLLKDSNCWNILLSSNQISKL